MELIMTKTTITKTRVFKWFCITLTLTGVSLVIAPVQAVQFSPEPGVVSEEFVFKTAPFGTAGQPNGASGRG